MRSIAKLIRRFAAILALSTLLLFIVNLLLLLLVAWQQTSATGSSTGPWTLARETAAALQITQDGYVLPDEAAAALQAENAWAIYIDNTTMTVVWHSENLPAEIPTAYTASDIAALTRGYLQDYPTATGESETGLLVVGFPKDRYWKHMYPLWDMELIRNAPYLLLAVLVINITLILMIYVVANSKLLRSVKPIADGIRALPSGKDVYVKEKGLLSDLAANINGTSELLRTQRQELRKTERARANWITGVSHDIRTPLSMVMGYAGQLEESDRLAPEDRKKAAVIRQQSVRIRNLVNDLNLASKLEYNMQPLHLEAISPVALARQCAADFVNADLEGDYPLEYTCDAQADAARINGDKDLLCRAVQNLLSNVQAHNPDGCRVFVRVAADVSTCRIAVEDDGAGLSDEQLEALQNTPHYMMSDGGTTEPRHGLGLLIVRQIVLSHGGAVTFTHGKAGGFCAEMTFPVCKPTGC